MGRLAIMLVVFSLVLPLVNAGSIITLGVSPSVVKVTGSGQSVVEFMFFNTHGDSDAIYRLAPDECIGSRINFTKEGCYDGGEFLVPKGTSPDSPVRKTLCLSGNFNPQEKCYLYVQGKPLNAEEPEGVLNIERQIGIKFLLGGYEEPVTATTTVQEVLPPRYTTTTSSPVIEIEPPTTRGGEGIRIEPSGSVFKKVGEKLKSIHFSIPPLWFILCFSLCVIVGGAIFIRNRFLIPFVLVFFLVMGLSRAVPQYSSYLAYPVSGSSYSYGQIHQFNVTWDNTVNLSYIEHNFTGTPKNYTMLNHSMEYYYKTDVPAGVFYWKSYARDSLSHWNSTPSSSYVIIKAISGGWFDLYLNNQKVDWNLTSGVPVWIRGSSSVCNSVGNNDFIYNLYRDHNLIKTANSSCIAEVVEIHHAGVYRYRFNSTGGQNYTGGSSVARHLYLYSLPYRDILITFEVVAPPPPAYRLLFGSLFLLIVSAGSILQAMRIFLGEDMDTHWKVFWGVLIIIIFLISVTYLSGLLYV